MRVRRGSSWALVLACALGAVACGGARPEVRAALRGTLPELQREIGRAESHGSLSERRLKNLARAVAEREIAGATGTEGAAHLATFRACAARVTTALNERAARGDEPSAVATLLLLEAGQRSPADLVARYQNAESGAFRALAARAATAPTYSELRRRYFTDPDERVRRGAFEAALKSPQPSHLADLLAAARLDPNGYNRARAAQAVGRIGSEPAVLGLLDLYSAGDEARQIAVLDAWSETESFRQGGERELARALDKPGLVSASAAILLLRSPAYRGAAVAVLARAIANGSDDEQRVALAAAPLGEASIKAALLSAARNPSPELTPLVLGRLAQLPGAGPEARLGLEKLAADKSDYGLESNYELARLGSERAIERLQGELTHPRASRRLRAAMALASLGKKQRLAPRLADGDPYVRATLACRLIAAR